MFAQRRISRLMVLCLFQGLAAIAIGQPANDNFVHAVELTGTNVFGESTSINATKQPGEPNHAGYEGGHSVWWKWTAPASGHVSIDSVGSTAISRVVAVYSGGNLSALQPIAAGSDPISFTAQAGTTYHIAMDQASVASNLDGSYELRLAMPPSNDELPNAIEIPSLGITMNGNNVGALLQPGEPEIGIGKLIWWRWTADMTGPVFVARAGSFITRQRVYTGTSLATLTPVDFYDYIDSFNQGLFFNAESGTVYYIAVDGVTGSGGVGIVLAAPPANDLFVNAATITGNVVEVSGNAMGAGREPGEPTHYSFIPHSVWWKWTAPASGRYVAGAGFEKGVGVYTGSAVDSLTAFGTGLGYVNFNATAGVSYYIAVDNLLGLDGNYTLRLQPVPANDNFADATIIVDSAPQQFMEDRLGATQESGENAHGVSSVRSMWWRWTAPTSGTVLVSTVGSDFRTGLGVYTGSVVNALSTVVTNRDFAGTLVSASNFDATAGQTYHIAIGGNNFNGTTVVLNFSADAILPAVLVQPADTSVVQGISAKFSVGAYGNPAPTYQWQRLPSGAFEWVNISGSGFSGATSANLSVGSSVASTSDQFRCVITNSAGSVISAPGALTVMPVPVNNAFANATILPQSASLSVDASNLHANKQSNEPNHAGLPGGSSVWWTWTAPGGGVVSLDTADSDFNTILAVYTGSNIGNLNEVASNNDREEDLTSAVTFDASEGTLYHFAVDGAQGASGNIVLNLAEVTTELNDSFVNATVLPSDGGTDAGNNTAAGHETGEPDHAGAPAAKSIWWKWISSANISVLAHTLGSGFDTRLAVYTGAELGGLTPVAANDNLPGQTSSLVNFAASAGVTYWIALDTADGAYGSCAMTLLPTALAPMFTIQPGNQTGSISGGAAFAVHAYGNPAPSQYQWQRRSAGAEIWSDLTDDPNHSGATTANLSITDLMLDMSGAQYRCIANNGVGSTASATATLTVTPPVAPVVATVGSQFAAGLGNSATLSATASGSPVPTYQWQRRAAGSNDWQNVPGATDAALEVTVSNISQAGEMYRVVATNSEGSANSRPAAILLPPALLAFPTLETNTTATGWVTLTQTPPPPGVVVNPTETGIVAVAAGRTHMLWLTSQGTVHGSGGTFGTSIPLPASVGEATLDNPIVSMSTWYGTIATRRDGARTPWGNVLGGDPIGDYASVHVSQFVTFGITPEQKLVQVGELSIPAEPPANLSSVIAVTAGSTFGLALKADGQVSVWGIGPGVEVPAGLSAVVSIHANNLWSLALKADGTVVQWGNAPGGLPAGLNNVAAIYAGYDHALALKRDGTVVAWGIDTYGQVSSPQGLTNVIAISAGVRSSAVLQKNTWDAPVFVSQPSSCILSPDTRTALLFASAVGPGTLTYQWYKDSLDNPISGATLPSYAVFGLDETANFYVRVSNSFGSVTSVPITVVPAPTVVQPVIHPPGGDFDIGQSVTVTLSSATPGATIRYTSDGSWPNANSTAYAEPFNISSYKTVRAQAFADGFAESADASAVFRYPAGVVGFGSNTSGVLNVPPGLDRVVAVAGGTAHALALESDGSVTAWGSNSLGQAVVPAGLSDVTAIAAGGNHSLALKSDGTVTTWGIGNGAVGTATGMPAGLSNVTAIAAGGGHSVVLRADGTLAAWGGNATVNTVPVSAFPFTAVAAGASHSLALRADGTVALWGAPAQPVAANLTGIVAIAAQGNTSLALKRDGTLVRFGSAGNISTASVPALVDIAGGSTIGVGLRPNGGIATWSGPPPTPSNFTAAGVGAGATFSLFIVPVTSPPAIVAQPSGSAIGNGESAVLSVQTSGTGVDYAWYQGQSGDTSAQLSGNTATSIVAISLTSPVRGNFTTPALTQSIPVWVRASNPAGSADSATAQIFVATPGYSTWAQSLGLASGAGHFAPDAQPFPDGLPNLLRYALNLGAAPASGQLPATIVEIVDGVPYMKLQFRRRKTLPGVALATQFSNDLGTWQDVPAENLTRLADDDADTERWEARLPLPPDGRLFLRLRATEN